MTYKSLEEQEIISNFLINNNLFIHKIEKKENILNFLKNIKVFQTNLIRVGSNNDGGYLVPDDLKNISACFSPGVDLNVSFETDLALKKIPSYLLDYSINKLPLENELFTFEKKYLDIKNDEKNININTWIKKNSEYEKKEEFILQMDIEGAEYQVLLDLEENLLQKFRIMIIEFHSLNNLLHPDGFKQIKAVFDKILEHFYIVHIHPNNVLEPLNYLGLELPRLLEISFLRKDRLNKLLRVSSLPHRLDKKNVENKKDVKLPHYWYKHG